MILQDQPDSITDKMCEDIQDCNWGVKCEESVSLTFDFQLL